MATADEVRCCGDLQIRLFPCRCFACLEPHSLLSLSNVPASLVRVPSSPPPPLRHRSASLLLCRGDPFVLRRARYAAGGVNEGRHGEWIASGMIKEDGLDLPRI